jgi:hypothetical protein
MACTDFDVSPRQHYLEGASAPGKHFYRQQHVHCERGLYGSYTVNCSGMMVPNSGGFCNGVGGKGVMVPGTYLV